MIRNLYCPTPRLSAKALGVVCLVFAAVYLYPLFGSENGRALLEQQSLKLLAVNTVYVDPLNGKSGAQQIRDMLIGSLHRAGLFVITEHQEQADAFLRGSAEDLIYSDYYRSYEGLRVRGSASSSERDSGESESNPEALGLATSRTRPVARGSMRPWPPLGWSPKAGKSSGQPQRKAPAAST